MPNQITQRYTIAAEQYADIGVDTDAAVKTLTAIPLSLPCWQGDDVTGFEKNHSGLTGSGLQVTGSSEGRARTPDELRALLERALSLIPGRHRVNLHAMYGEFGDKPADRDAVAAEHFSGWMDWAAVLKLSLDFNPTCFAHPRAADGLTLSSPDPSIRNFWIEHVTRCRGIATEMGARQGGPAVCNLWIPDGCKDLPADRLGFRQRLRQSLDAVYTKSLDPALMADSLESKLFGIGSEAFTAGSYDFYLAYALAHRKMICLDTGHFHPTEDVADKLSALLPFTDELLLHISRPLRWDSDHIPVLDDRLRLLAEEIIRCGHERFHLALDFFDASLSRAAGYVTGARAVQKALLLALLQPAGQLRQYEAEGRCYERLQLRENCKMMPAGAVWDHFCLQEGCVPDKDLIAELSPRNGTL